MFYRYCNCNIQCGANGEVAVSFGAEKKEIRIQRRKTAAASSEFVQSQGKELVWKNRKRRQ